MSKSDNGKIWYKEKIGKGDFYFLDASLKSSIEFLNTSVLETADGKEKLAKYINDNAYDWPTITKVNDSHISFSRKLPRKSMELPYGFYVHKESRGPMPERLETIKVRAESYFDIHSNMEYVQKDIELFLQSREIYEEMRSIYKRGYLLYGPPGNGKTGFIRNLVNNVIPKDSYVVWLNSMPSESMLQVLNSLSGLKILIIEEVTANTTNSCRVKELLTFLDGEDSLNNSIIVGTTNYPAELEKNLADRPQRFDVKIFLDNPDEKQAKYFFESFLSRTLEENEVSLKDLAVAHIKEICLRHKMYKMPLNKAHAQVMKDRKLAKNHFQQNKTSIGLNSDATDADLEDARQLI